MSGHNRRCLPRQTEKGQGRTGRHKPCLSSLPYTLKRTSTIAHKGMRCASRSLLWSLRDPWMLDARGYMQLRGMLQQGGESKIELKFQLQALGMPPQVVAVAMSIPTAASHSRTGGLYYSRCWSCSCQTYPGSRAPCWLDCQ